MMIVRWCSGKLSSACLICARCSRARRRVVRATPGLVDHARAPSPPPAPARCRRPGRWAARCRARSAATFIGDAEQPRVERRLPAERRAAPAGPDERLLRDVPRLLPVAQVVVGQAPDPLRGTSRRAARTPPRRPRRHRSMRAASSMSTGRRLPTPHRHGLDAGGASGPLIQPCAQRWLVAGRCAELCRTSRAARARGSEGSASRATRPSRVALRAEAGDLAAGDGGDDRVPAELLPAVDVGEVDLDHRAAGWRPRRRAARSSSA